MRITDAALLASTKFRSRVLRSITIGIMAGMLFGVMILGSFVLTGMSNGILSYSNKGYGNRYIVSLSQITDFEKIQEETQKRITAKEAEIIAEAKKKGTFNADTPPQLSEQDYNKISSDVMTQLYPPPTVSEVEQLLAGYNDTQVYQTQQLSAPGSMGGSGAFTPIVDGKEYKANGYFGSGKSIDSFMLNAKDWKLVQPFELEPSIYLDESKIPILIPSDTALQLAGVTINDRESLDDAVAKKREAREKVIGTELKVCYRNKSAKELLDLAVAQSEEMERNKNNKDYKAPSLQYAVPAEPCLPVTVSKDTRTKEEKDVEAKLRAQLKTPDPITGLISFTIAGFVPPTPNFSTFDLSSVLQTGPQGEFIVPVTRIASNTYLQTAVSNETTTNFPSFMGGNTLYYAEFANRADQKRFIESQCVIDSDFSVNPFKDCLDKGIKFSAQNYGNPRVQVEEQVASIIKGSRVVITIMFVIASILMMLAVSKVIADSRRETGVFRAIGAKRFDIAQIYMTYAAYLATFSFLIATVLALAVSTWLTNKYSDRITLQAIDNFAVYENPTQIVFFGFDIQQLGIIFGIALLAGLVGGFIPITGNVRRNPIKDMRDE